MTRRTGLAPARLTVLALVLALVLMAVAVPVRALAGEWRWLLLPDGARMPAEVMFTAEQRARGLMYLKNYPDDRLMLFHYPDNGDHRLWMKNCHFPIDAAWIDSGGTVLAVERDIPPCPAEPCPLFGPATPSRHFVEGTVGWLDRHGVAPGQLLRLEGVAPEPGEAPEPAPPTPPH